MENMLYISRKIRNVIHVDLIQFFYIICVRSDASPFGYTAPRFKDVHLNVKLKWCIYRIARNFRGLKFSRMSLAQTFRDLIFEDCVRARRRLKSHAQYVVQG